MAELTWDDLTADADVLDAPIPEGEYTLAVDEVEYRLSKGDDPQFAMKLLVTDEGAQKGRPVWHYATAVADSPGAKRAFVKCVRAFLGAGVRLPLNNGTPEENAGPFFGKSAKAKLKHESYQGQTNARVAFFIENKADTPPAPSAAADTPPPAAAAPADTPPPMPVD